MSTAPAAAPRHVAPATTEPPAGPPDGLTLAAFAAIVMIGGANFVAVRFSNRELDPLFAAGARFGIAGALLFAVAAIGRMRLPRGRAAGGAALYGAINFAAGYAFLYYGLREVPAGLGAVILGLIPLLTLLLAWAHRIERFQARGLAGAVLAVAGITVIAGSGSAGGAPLLSMLSMVAGAACAAEAGVLIKLFPKSHPITTNAVGMVVGALLLLPVSLLTGETWGAPPDATTWAWSIYLVIVGSMALFALFVFVVKRWTASATSYVAVLFPVTATLLGAWLLGEAVTVRFAIGALVVLAGVYVGALMPSRSRARS